ncbi:DNA/RNA non-specific endonuclease (plasmid) [Kovacikia minuta CCNUW1]|uniref:DNA/RNA non-specific endonuclease n=1 Tax=Kovacikia minuta TaxID=2931930 RepID=UPI001CCEFC28|nr:DNA/RNA non-specific endonuclease [Kovacikia minuta]UBF30786.1 DNA/RNA non-specific endonuclease [Kovacikia minuta CCNUW1]
MVIALTIFFGVVALADLNYGSVHLIMGNPSQATATSTNSSNYLMLKPEYALSYNRERNIPNWVSWQLNAAWLGDAPRQDNFRPDLTLPSGWYRVTPANYTNSGFDRGHLMSSEDRGVSVAANSATFLMTNIIPQAPDNNRGPWVQFETYCRELVKDGKELYIIAGGAGFGGTGEKGLLETLTNSKVTVPASTWKVVLVLDKPGLRLQGVTEKTRAIAVVIPNKQGIRHQEWRSFRASVDSVEALTGYDFFSNVPQPVQSVIEAGLDNL